MAEKPEQKQNRNDFDAILNQVFTEAVNLGIPVSNKIIPFVRVNTRAKSRFGCCKQERSAAATVFVIEISERLAHASETAVRQTLAHEILHTCAGCNNHGARWSHYAKKMNQAYGYQIKRTATPEEMGLAPAAPRERRVNYVLICTSCGARIERARMSNIIKHPQMYRCKCGGALKRER